MDASQKYVNVARVIKFVKSVHESKLISRKEINFDLSSSSAADDKKALR